MTRARSETRATARFRIVEPRQALRVDYRACATSGDADSYRRGSSTLAYVT